MRKRKSQEAMDRADLRILPDQVSGQAHGDGPMRSVQEADLNLTTEQLEELWKPEMLERLARAYWRFLERRSLHLLRVVYGSDYRSISLGSKRLSLLRFHAPEFDTGPEYGRVTWRIDRGLLVAPAGRGKGFLRFDVRRLSQTDDGLERVRIRMEVANFYPMLRGSGRIARFGAILYGQTQSRIHVWISHGFLKSLGRLELPELRPERREAYE